MPNGAHGQLAHRGSLFIHGGGDLDGTVGSFAKLAGGDAARLVVIPTAASDENLSSDGELKGLWRERGFDSVTVLHTRDRTEADSKKFTSSIDHASAVFFCGGDQQRLANAYVGTRTELALENLLSRGGVIGGTSAGAAIMTRVMIAHGKESPFLGTGLDLLPFGIIDQHFLNRSRTNRLTKAVRASWQRTGIGIDEGTCLTVSKNRATVKGKGYVTLIRNINGSISTETFGDKDSFDLSDFGFTRRQVDLPKMELPGVAELAETGRPFEVFVPESVSAAMELRQSLLKSNRFESQATTLQRLSKRFAVHYRERQKQAEGPSLFDFSQIDFESAIRGNSKCPTAQAAYGSFSGKWFGRWADRDVDHHWSRVVPPGELAFATKHPQFQVGWQYAWIGDGYGINHCLSFKEQGRVKRFLLGYTEHLVDGDFERIAVRRPHVGISAGPGKLIWITAKEVFFEESRFADKDDKGSSPKYSIVGFRYLANGTDELAASGGFVTEYSANPENRSPFRDFESSFSAKRLKK